MESENNNNDMTLLGELRRRNVLRTSVIYAVVAWSLIQLSDMAFPRLGFPEWMVTLVLMVSVFGFPFCVALAWVYDVTPTGVQRTSSAPHGQTVELISTHKFDVVVILLVITTVVLLWLDG